MANKKKGAAAAADVQKSAEISACEQYRYLLERRWGEGAPLVFVMLNPSTADADKDDATIRKCIGFATRYGYNAIAVVNLFAFRATDPKDLKAASFPVGPGNDEYILAAALMGGNQVVCAWGANANRTPRPAKVSGILKAAGASLKCLGTTQDGFPLHPCMLSYDRPLLDYVI